MPFGVVNGLITYVPYWFAGFMVVAWSIFVIACGYLIWRDWNG